MATLEVVSKSVQDLMLYNKYLHHFFLIIELRHQDVFAVCDSGQRDSQSPGGPMVAVGGQSAHHYMADNLHQVKGGMHGSQETLPRLLGNLNDARPCVSCRVFKEQVSDQLDHNQRWGLENMCCFSECKWLDWCKIWDGFFFFRQWILFVQL